MVKVFFADGGTLEQLRTTLTAIAETADARLTELEAKVDRERRGDVPFPERLPLNTIGLRFHARSRAGDRRLGAVGARPDRRVELRHRPGSVGLPNRVRHLTIVQSSTPRHGRHAPPIRVNGPTSTISGASVGVRIVSPQRSHFRSSGVPLIPAW